MSSTYGRPTTPFADLEGLLCALTWEPIAQHPKSPVPGDVIMYRDGTIAVVGNSPEVSYGERSEMQTVARLWPRDEDVAAGGGQPDDDQAADDDGQDDEETSLDEEVDS